MSFAKATDCWVLGVLRDSCTVSMLLDVLRVSYKYDKENSSSRMILRFLERNVGTHWNPLLKEDEKKKIRVSKGPYGNLIGSWLK